MFLIAGMRKSIRRFVGTLKKMVGSSSGRSQGGSSSLRSSTPTQSYTREPEESYDEPVESQAPEQHQEEEMLDDSHIELRGEREFQAYNILRNRTFGHT